MRVSLRSSVATTAMVGATAIAITPAVGVQSTGLPALQASPALAAFANPITLIAQDAGIAIGYLLNGIYSLDDPGLNWAGRNAPTSPVLNAALQSDALGAYRAPGVLPQILLNPFPIATQWASNALGYLYNTAASAASVAGYIGDILWSIPTTAIAVTIDLVTLNFSQAIADLNDAVFNAIQNISLAGYTLLNAGGYVLTNLIAKGTAVVDAVVNLVPKLIDATAGQVSYLAATLADIGSSIVSSLTTLNPEAIWNSTVEGLLGSEGLTGALLNLTLGPGVQIGPISVPSDIEANFVPSLRTEAQIGVQAVADALATVPTLSAPAAGTPADEAPVAAEIDAPVTAAAPVQARDAESADAPNASARAGAGRGGASAGGSEESPKASAKARAGRPARAAG
ncbi:MAG: hypothetical protein ACKOB8_12320 [Mycobacterium sp.]